MRVRGWLLIAVGLCLAANCAATAADPATSDDTNPAAGIRAPQGFEVSLYAGDDLAHDIFSMTLDARGRVVVAGLGYVRTLHDDDGDGHADRAVEFSSLPKSGAHGLLSLGNDLLCTGDDSLMLLRDSNADGVADGPPEAWAKLRHPEHGANGITRGPDGWIHVICGNDAGVTKSLAAAESSPVQQPQSGAVVRFSPDGRQSEIFAHGFRNPYDLDFNTDGRLFTVDADGERDHHLPWYTPTRLFDIAQGMHHGWVLQGWTRSWSRPGWMFDSAPRLAELGRGSPTGLTVYRHAQFPEKYRGSVLSCCWTLGRVYALPLAPAGASYTSQPETFLETTGEVGFAPVDIAVGPSGDLFVAIGGRRTRGSVFRVRYTGALDAPGDRANDSLAQVLHAPQPGAAWSRASWEPQARELGRTTFVAAMNDGARCNADRARAAEILVDLFEGVQASEIDQVSERAIWALGRSNHDAAALKTITSATSSSDLATQRSAWEALDAVGVLDAKSQAAREAAAWDAGLNSADRHVRAAALLADVRRSDTQPGESTETDLWRLAFRHQLQPKHFDAAAEVFLGAEQSAVQLNAVRLMELTLGDIDTQQQKADVYAGYSLSGAEAEVAAAAERYGERLAAGFPASDAALNQEWSRLLGALRVDSAPLLEQLATLWTSDSSPQDDVHYLIVASRLPAARSPQVTQATAAAIAGLQPKLRKGQMYVSRNWTLRVGEAVAELYRRDPQLAAAIVADESFLLASQAFLADAMPSDVRKAAARKLARCASESNDDRWTEELVQLVAELPNNEALPILRTAYEDFAMREAVLPVLARARQAEDRERFVAGLSSITPRTVELSAAALTMLPGDASETELLAAVAALDQTCSAPEQPSTRQTLAQLLAHWSGEAPSIDESASRTARDAYQPWFGWFERTHPTAAAKLSSLGGANSDEWQKRLAAIDWQAGDVAGGSEVFQKKSCVRCHAGASPLGPDLAGAAGRLSRADMLAAIVDPNKDVSPLYQTTQIVTGGGKTYHGLIVYDSPEGTLLQTAPDSTIRIMGDEIVVQRKSKTSLMPTGLLNDVTDAQLADLFAYLKSLKAPR